MRITTIIICAIVFSIVIGGFGMFLQEGINIYDNTYNYSELAKLDNINESYSFAVETSTTLKGGNEQESQDTTDSSLRLDRSVNVFYKSITMIKDQINQVGLILGLPDWLIYSALAIMLVVVSVAIIVLIGMIRGNVA